MSKKRDKRLKHRNFGKLRGFNRLEVLKSDKRYKFNSDGVPIHRLAYEEEWGPIEDGWHVHHLDTNPTNNNPQNLVALPPKCHQWLHWNQIQLRRKYDRNGAIGFLEAFLNRQKAMLVAMQRNDLVLKATAITKFKALKMSDKTAKKIRKN